MVQSRYGTSDAAARIINKSLAQFHASLVKYQAMYGPSPFIKSLEPLVSSQAQKIIIAYKALDDARNKFQQCNLFFSRFQKLASSPEDQALVEFLERKIESISSLIPTDL